jgi:integrase
MDTKYLSKQHQTWILRVKVPADLREQEGQNRITVSLQTSDLREARTRRDIELGRLRERWTKMREGDNASPSTLRWLLDRLAHVREENLDAETAYIHASELLDVFLKEQREEVAEESAEAIRAAMASISDPTFTSLVDARESYLRELKVRARQQTYKERAGWLKAFIEWAGEHRGIGTVTRQEAGRYLSEELMGLDLSPTTVRNRVGGLSSFFGWAEHRGLSPSNPFRGLSTTVRSSNRGARRKERPWTQDELVKFFSEVPGDDPRWTLGALALYTGMRREEVCSIEAVDVKGEGVAIEIPEGKTESSIRVVPIHPVIRPLVKSLIENTADGYLLTGLRRMGPNQQRGKYIGKQFAAKLASLGLSGVRLHDLRRTTSQGLRDAGVPMETAEYIIGHRVQSMTYGYYSPGPSFDRLREAMEMVSFGPVDALVARDTVAQ